MPKYKHTFFKGISFSYLYIFVYLITGVLTTPLLLNYFQADYFALLMLIYGLITYLNNIRFGLPESLAALLAKSKDKSFNQWIIKKSFLILVLIVVFIIGLIFLINIFIEDWRFILGDVYDLSRENVLSVFFILIIFALLKIPAELSLSIFIGLHVVYLEKIYKILNLLINFLLILIVVYFGMDIVSFAFLAGFLDLLVTVVALIHLIVKYKYLQDNVVNESYNISSLLASGFLFFQVSMTQTIIWGTGIFLISHMLSLQDVAVYSLTMKIYIYIFYALVVLNTVLAPLYGRLFAEGAWERMNDTFSMMLLLFPFVGGFIWMGTLYFMSDVMTLWTGSENFFIGNWYVFYIGIFFYFIGYVNSYITILYSIGEVKSVVSIRWMEVIVSLFVSLVAVYFLGLVGVAIGMSIAIILTSVLYLPKQIVDKSDGKVSLNFDIQKKHFLLIILPNILIAFIVAIYVELFMIKFLVFLLMSIYYIWYSWLLLPIKKKETVMLFLNYRKKDNY
ncbi:oligosaccharide flippase family protein [Sulfurimonas sp.]|uniref:lipopolysaccharide biosynthesis protein n=1 Tax=Sulfurimonas sp. TaxID=2022749 RepID=UPI00260896C9|nr:oligosaccharide flippase family protein [Sulfurimonas sp.]MCW8895356.1 oligosaccharide flippase family protein [Sulfurimonas sp.]MCW9067499.1 oligosaccharide flippase family protein [Sulfurimonas sp.]